MGIYNSNFDFNKYRAFYAVADTKSFSKAAETLHISQPAISYSIRELEEQLGVKLFMRENKNVKLTDKGEQLLTYVEKAFNNIIMAERAVSENDRELTGSVRIGIYSHIALIMLPPLIKGFIERYPKASFTVHASSTDELKDKLKNKELDFIILQYPVFIEETNYTEEIFGEMENCFFSGKKYYDLYMKNHKTLVEYPFILPMRGYDDINALEETLKRKNMYLTCNSRIYTIELRKILAEQDVGIGWGLKKYIQDSLNEKKLYEVPVDFPIPKTKFSISYDKKYLNNTAIEFLKYFKDNISDIIK